MGFRIALDDGFPARTLDVHAARTTVGRSASCRMRLVSDGVARMHAVFRHDDGTWLVEAVGRATLQVDGQTVTCAVLRRGTVVEMGRARLKVLDVGPEVEAAGASESIRPRAPTALSAVAPSADVLPPARRANVLARCLAGSALAHAALLAVLWGAGLFDARPREREVELSAGILLEIPTLRAEDEPEPPPPEPPAAPPEVERPPLPDVELPRIPPEFRDSPFPQPAEPPPVAPPPDVPPPTNDPPPDATPEPVPVRTVVGIGGDAPNVPARSFGKNEADDANRRAAEFLVGDAAAGALLGGVRGAATAASVVVVRGDYDQAEKTLDVLGIRHALVAKETLERASLPATVRVLIYNCTGKPMPADVQRRVAEWVAAGGHLITTDWGVERLLEKGFPGTLVPLRRGGRQVMTPDETVEVQPATSGSALLSGVPLGGEAPRWWLEDTSLPFEAAEGLTVDVLVRSETLDRRHGSPMVAAAFPYGKGRVLHLLGHLHQREGNLRGAYMVQRILVNFLGEALR